MTQETDLEQAWRQRFEPVGTVSVGGRAYVWREKERSGPYSSYPLTTRHNGRTYTLLREVARTEGYALQTLRSYCWDGRIPCVKHGKCWYIHVQGLREYMRAHQRGERKAAVMAWIKAHRNDNWTSKKAAWRAMQKEGVVISLRGFQKAAARMGWDVKRTAQRIAEYVVEHELRDWPRGAMRAEVERGLRRCVSEPLLAYALRKVDHEMGAGRTTPDPAAWLTVEEAAALLKKWPSGVRRLANQGQIEQRLGKRRRRYYGRASIEAYIKARCDRQKKGVMAQIRRYYEVHPEALNERVAVVARRTGFNLASVWLVRKKINDEAAHGAA